MLVYILLSCSAFLVYVFIKKCTNEKFRIIAKIPGPKGIPIFVNALQVDLEHIHKDLLRWTEEYGPIFKLNFAGDLVVVLKTVMMQSTKLLSQNQQILQVVQMTPSESKH
ncbi:unnamed protein product [Owenia fusiformis]|uniref:Uncharacterized protein n=1 Tax=Owenia fusiformis TaxID=6347 RepID=A0A8J1UFQ5_OWEFU|nr:unnamed protein product [Owenia fusiformis]